MRRTRARALERRNTERETINRICSANISIVLKYLLLKVNLRFKSQHAVLIFYESRNFKGIKACICLNLNETLHNRLLQDKEMTVRHDCDQSEHVFLKNIPLTCWLTLSLYYLYYYLHFLNRFKLYSLYTMLNKCM